MDVYRFINSKNVAEHLYAVGHEFTAYEAAYFVEHCIDATLCEKISAWNEIAEAMPDCPAAWDHNFSQYKSTRAFLREYIKLQQRMLDEFVDGSGSVYIVRKMRRAKNAEEIARGCGDLWIDEQPYPYSAFAKCVDHLRAMCAGDDEKFDQYTISRVKIDIDEELYSMDNNQIILDGDFQPLKVLVGGLNEHDEDLLRGLRSTFIEMPVPFMRGDIVIDRAACNPHPFVFDRLTFWNSTELAEHGAQALSPEEVAARDAFVARFDEKHGWDDSHMVAYGCELGFHYNGGPLESPYDFCYDEFGASDNYLNLELYRGPLDGELELLDIASRFLKGKIGIGAFLNQTRLTSLACHAKQLERAYDGEYSHGMRHLYKGESNDRYL